MGMVARLVLILPLSILWATDAPAGFQWHKAAEVKAAFLRPRDWHFKVERSRWALTYYVTKEKIRGSRGRFQTGLSIKVIVKSEEAFGMQALPYARRYISELVANRNVENADSFDLSENMKGFEVRFDSKSKKGKKMRMVFKLIANTKTDTMYFVAFESPIRRWSKQWRYGKQMLDSIKLAPDY